jgi:hypothetical protein
MNLPNKEHVSAQARRDCLKDTYEGNTDQLEQHDYTVAIGASYTRAIVGTNYKPREGRDCLIILVCYSLLPASTGFQHQQLLLRETVRDLSKTVVVLVPNPLVVLGKIYQVAQANPDLVAQSLLDSTILANPKAQAF